MPSCAVCAVCAVCVWATCKRAPPVFAISNPNRRTRCDGLERSSPASIDAFSARRRNRSTVPLGHALLLTSVSASEPFFKPASHRYRYNYTRTMRTPLLYALLLLGAVAPAMGKAVTISNAVPRRNVTGDIMDAHDGTYNQWFPGGPWYYYAMGYGDCKQGQDMCRNPCGYGYSWIGIWKSPDMSEYSFNLCTKGVAKCVWHSLWPILSLTHSLPSLPHSFQATAAGRWSARPATNPGPNARSSASTRYTTRRPRSTLCGLSKRERETDGQTDRNRGGQRDHAIISTRLNTQAQHIA
jgi:hypothetical protein